VRFLAGEIAMAIWRKRVALLGAAAILALGACADDSLRLSAAAGGTVGGPAPTDAARARDPMEIRIRRAFSF